MRISRHAEERMAERNIGRATLNAVLASGEIMGKDQNDNVHLELLWFRAVVAPVTETVVTVFENRERRSR